MHHEIYQNCRFCICSDKNGYMYDMPEKIIEDNVIDSDSLEDIFTDKTNLPTAKGVYQCDIDVKYWAPSYHDADGDIEIIPINIIKLL